MWNDRELQHWLGMTLADWLFYVAIGCVVALFLSENPAGDLLLAIGAVGFGLLSFLVGWRHERECSDEANFMNLVCYPLGFILSAGGVIVHYVCS